MAKTSFKPEEAQSNPVAETETAVATTAPSEVAAPVAQVSERGEITAADIAIPYINLGQKSGTMCDDHPEWLGHFIYDKELDLGDRFTACVWTYRKFYQEDLEYGSSEIPRRYDRIADARDEQVDVIGVAELILIFETEDETIGMFEAEGKRYGLAKYFAKKAPMKSTLGKILLDEAGWLQGHSRNGFYEFISKKKTGNGNTWWAPEIKAAGKTPDSLKQAVGALFG